MELNETATELECRKEGLDIVEYPLYRFGQVFYTALSLAALPPLLNLQIKHIFNSTFHRNIKIILLVYYSLAVLHALAYSMSQIFALISSLTKNACDFFPPIYIYVCAQLALVMTSFGLILSLVAICIERIVATIRSRKYESNGITLGLLLVVLLVLSNTGATWYVFQNENDFNVKVVWIPAIPPGAVKRFNGVAKLNIVISIACIIMFRLSSQINKKRFSVSGATLTSRFQTRENVVTTEFATCIGSLQVSFFIFYLTSGIIVRVFADELFHKNTKLFLSIRQLCYIAPIFTFVLPIYSVNRLKHYRLHRESNIRSIVTMESKGAAGARNYEDAIAKSWSVKTTTLKR